MLNVRGGEDNGSGKQKPNAYLTVCLALCLAVILSLCMTLIDGARRNGARMETECVMDIGLQSIMAEYHRELMKQYNLFAIDSSYGTGSCSKVNTESHLRKYLARNFSYDDILFSKFIYGDFFGLEVKDARLKKVSILTDYDGGVFRNCAVEAVKSDIGIGLLQDIQEWMQVVEVNGLEEGKEEAQKQDLDAQIGEWMAEYNGTEVEIEEGEWETVELYNPTEALEGKKSLGILKLVTEGEETLSQNALDTDNLVMARMERGQINRGNLEQKAQSETGGLLEKFLFQEYLLQCMGRYGAECEEDALRYQIEYLIVGNGSDIENLRSMANRLCILREAANAMYLWSNEAKRAEIKLIAGLVCTLILLPELIPILEGAILLAWAYAESIYDVKTLLAGGKVPLLKDDNSWHYGLSAALAGDLQDKGAGEEGLGYIDYLRIFMMFTNVNTITARAMNMVEADIRNTPGNSAFRLDGCYETVEAYVKVGSRHGFEYEITRRKSYH